jgi:YHS domain-containing protein
MPQCGIILALNIKQNFNKGGTIMRKSKTLSHTFIDPVCLMQVDPSSKNIMFTHQMHTYYFCAEKCRDIFKANPGKYLESKPLKRKGWWGRYLDRLNKTTGGKPPKCCH